MNRSVFITGGSRGIGAATVKKFAGEGWNVVFTYSSHGEKAESLQSELSFGGAKVRSERVDFLEADSDIQIENALKRGLEALGICSFDSVVINAGISVSGTADAMKNRDLEALLDVNLKGAIATASKAIPFMVSAKSGSMVFVSSMWGQRGASYESIYSATKGGVDSFAKSLAKELGPSGIRVNVVSPGVIDTDMNKAFTDEDMKVLAEATPLGRIGSPREVAEAIYFLSDNDKSSFVTGQILGVDGGIII